MEGVSGNPRNPPKTAPGQAKFIYIYNQCNAMIKFFCQNFDPGCSFQSTRSIGVPPP